MGCASGAAAASESAVAANVVPQDANQYSVKQSAGNPENLGGLNRYDWFITPDGTKAWTWRDGTTLPGSFRQYDVSPAWSITFGDWTFDNEQLIGGSNARTFEWSRDGNYLAMLTRWFSSSYQIHVYDQSATPFDSNVLGSSTLGQNLPVSVFQMRWRPDGLMVFLTGSATTLTAQTVTVAWDASTIVTSPVASFDFSIEAGVGALDSFCFSADGMKLYGNTSTNLLCSWSLTAPWDISAPFNFQTGVSLYLPTTLANARGALYRWDTGDIFWERDQSTQNVRCWEPSSAPQVSEFSFDSEADLTGGLLTIPTTIWVSPDGLHLYVTEETISSNHVFWHEMSVAHDLSTISVTDDHHGDGQSVRGFALREDGTEMFTNWRNPTNPDGFFDWDLTVTWDISTTVTRTSILSASSGNNPRSLHFKPDGTEMYASEDADDLIYQYTLSTPWVLTTATNTNTFDYTNEITVSSPGFTMSSDGKKMYVIDGVDQTIEQYNLGTAWDLSTAVYANVTPLDITASGSGVSARDLSLRDNDTKLYVIYNDAIVELWTV
jgi:DNA-binding beta-propeller fold protein YncE